MLLANSVHELNLGVRPRVKGNKFMFINVVDIEYHVLVRSWLVSVICRAPYITKSFELQLPVGGGKGSNKRISYTTAILKGKSSSSDVIEMTCYNSRKPE
ncbi:nephrocystin-4-like [Strongylocentrotus purpuratus]|uniref:Uncharacterized protein n=1 Tax=Strongylocentrotus purpuratus TaxID=7668 RepID=A0A7M7NVQ8_STRPU|nr:nephrocystin-4-like [Strongylocentrotus purpuratus]